MKCNKYKFDLIVAVLVLIFLFIGSLFVSYQIGKTQGVKSQQAEILVLRNLNTTHLQKVDSLEIEVLKLQKMVKYPEEMQKEIKKKQFYLEELPKLQENVRATKEGTKEHTSAVLKMLTEINKIENLKPQKKGF
jgi:uncharacterized protein YlxW (UPF0749 family)